MNPLLRRLLPVAILLISTLFGVQAQPTMADQVPELRCGLLPLAPARRVSQSTLIVEATVLDALSYRAGGRLFTRHHLRVFSLLKGQAADTTGLTLISEGGRLGPQQEILTNTLRLVAGQQGVLFLCPAPWPGAAGGWAVYGSLQGFIEYNETDGTAAEPFRQYPAVDAAFYAELARQTGQLRQVLRPRSARAVRVNQRPAANPANLTGSAQGTLAPTLDSLSPLQITAGTGAVVTLIGTGFGAAQGTGFVEFKNADDGGATGTRARPADYLTWTDTQIRVRVPSVGSGGHPAGTGLVRLTTADQLTVESPDVLTIIYALTNVESTDGRLLQTPSHVALDAVGGITFRFGPNFVARPGFPESWQRALATWRCQTGINWQVGPAVVTNAIASDGQNVVAFDVGGELPANVLARTTSYYQGCFTGSGTTPFYVAEIDMQFDDGRNFQSGPALAAAPAVDFESVAVHELGHAQQLGHLIRRGAVMHFGIAQGQNSRQLTAGSDVAGGRRVLRERSFQPLGCGGPALLPAPLTALGARVVPGTGVRLTWATRDECFLVGFVVERSTAADTLGPWLPVATLPIAVGSTYQTLDPVAPNGLIYYRLGLRRPDGSTDYAAPLPVLPAGPDAVALTLFPNPVPAAGQAQIQLTAAKAAVLRFQVYDAVGRARLTRIAGVQPGLNVLTLDVTALVPGWYVLVFNDEDGTKQYLGLVKE